MSDYNNVYNYFVKVTTNLLMGNIFTLNTHNDTLNVLTNANQQLTEAWTTGAAGPDIQKQLDLIIAAGEGSPPDPGGKAEAKDLDDFIHTYLSGGDGTKYLSQYSQAVGAQLMSLMALCYGNIPNGAAAADMNAVNSLNSIISAKGNYEEQIGQNESKTEGSVVQQDTSAQQPIANCADSIEGIFGNVASLIQQIYS